MSSTRWPGSSIERQHGVLHRFLEDGVVGIFGVPLEDRHQEDHALRAAINIVRLINVMQQKWAQQGRRALRVGIGVNSGIVIAGDAGFANRREYTIVGPDVTLAPRLQAATFDLNAGRSCPTSRRRARPTKTTTGRRCRYEIRAALRAVRAQSLARSA